MTEQDPMATNKADSLFARLARARPTKPGEIYGIPGQGNTLWLSVGSIVLFFFVWWLVTFMGWVKSAGIEQIHATYSFGATRWQVMRYVIMPSAMPEILTAMRIGIGFGWTTLVAAEMVASTKGLGYMVLSASQFLQTPVVIMGIFVIAVIAFAFDLLMRFVERRVVPWKGRM